MQPVDLQIPLEFEGFLEVVASRKLRVFPKLSTYLCTPFCFSLYTLILCVPEAKDGYRLIVGQLFQLPFSPSSCMIRLKWTLEITGTSAHAFPTLVDLLGGNRISGGRLQRLESTPLRERNHYRLHKMPLLCHPFAPKSDFQTGLFSGSVLRERSFSGIPIDLSNNGVGLFFHFFYNFFKVNPDHAQGQHKDAAN